jgi:hypothetical protein
MPAEEKIGENIIKEPKENILNRIYAERRPAEEWAEFQTFEKDLKFKISQEVARVTEKAKKGMENVSIFSDSLDISPEKLREIKTEGESEILKVEPETLRLGENTQIEINAQLEKIQGMYAEFSKKITAIEEKVNRILLDMETKMRDGKIEEVREEINKIEEIHE